MPKTQHISPVARDISHVAFIDRDAIRGAAWEGFDGWDYTARMFEDEQTGPYLQVQCFDQEGHTIRTEWRLPETTNLLLLVANGRDDAPVYWTDDSDGEFDDGEWEEPIGPSAQRQADMDYEASH